MTRTRGSEGRSASLPFAGLLSTLLVIPVLPAHAQQLAIYLNTNDCINCTSAVSQLPLLDPHVQVMIYADEAKRRFVPEVLSRYGVTSDKWPVHYIPTAELEAMASPASQCRFTAEGMHELDFPLKEIGGYIGSMNVHARSYTAQQRIPFKDPLLLSDRANFFVGPDRIVVTDYLLGEAYEIALRGEPELSARRVFFPAHFERRYFTAIGLDTARYDSLQPLMHQMGKDKLIVQSANFSGDTTQLLVDVFYPDRDPEDNTSTMIQNYRCFMDLVNGELVSWRRCDWSMPDSLPTYLQYPDEAFSLGAHMLTSPMAEVPAGAEPPLLFGRYAFNDHSMHFAGLIDARLPAEVKREGRKDVIYAFGATGDLLFVRCYPYFYDASDGRAYDLSAAISNKHRHFFFEKEEVRYWTEDARWMDDRTLMVIYNRNAANETWLVWIDVEDNKVLRHVAIPKEGIVPSSLRILADGRVIALSTDYAALLILQ